jgi:hypothetical protein
VGASRACPVRLRSGQTLNEVERAEGPRGGCAVAAPARATPLPNGISACYREDAGLHVLPGRGLRRIAAPHSLPWHEPVGTRTACLAMTQVTASSSAKVQRVGLVVRKWRMCNDLCPDKQLLCVAGGLLSRPRGCARLRGLYPRLGGPMPVGSALPETSCEVLWPARHYRTLRARGECEMLASNPCGFFYHVPARWPIEGKWLEILDLCILGGYNYGNFGRLWPQG